MFFLLVVSPVLQAQPWPAPELPDTSGYGLYTSRTLHLLHSSTAEEPNTVKILVYGQSISEQAWWLQVKAHLESRFPHVRLIMENKAIGGFSSQILCKTVEMDVSSFYPDLVLLHIYGSNTAYDSVLYTIRSRTTAEVAIQTDHYTGENAWSDTMSYHLLPALAEKYKCDVINIRDPWKKYLAERHLQPADLLRDNVHLNAWGEFLMAELIMPFFDVYPGPVSDPLGLLTTFRVGEDIDFEEGVLVLEFDGNRAVAVFDTAVRSEPCRATVRVDGHAPSEYAGTWFMTRPYANDGRAWPWQLPAMIRVQRTAPWVEEEWTCTFTEAGPPYDDFQFEIRGSHTGFDGAGRGSEDFVSLSGRVIIGSGDAQDGGDWHLKRSYRVLKTETRPGDVVRWKTYSTGVDTLLVPAASGPDADSTVTLFQGIPNGPHQLAIRSRDGQPLPLVEIRVYRPPF